MFHPTKLLFGTAGIPLSTEPRATENGIKRVAELGLDSMELEFVHSVNIVKEKTALIKKLAKENNIILTCHAPYYINLNSNEAEKIEASAKRILQSAEINFLCGGWSVCFHSAYYMKQDSEQVFQKVKSQLKEIVKLLKTRGIDIWIRPETAGRVSQFGKPEELIKLAQELEMVLPCFDFAHVLANTNGKFNTIEEFKNLFSKIESGLGRTCLDNMHIHMEGIEYNHTGERFHKNLEDSNFNWQDLLRVFKEFKIKGVVICESPNIEGDALMMKRFYEKI